MLVANDTVWLNRAAHSQFFPNSNVLLAHIHSEVSSFSLSNQGDSKETMSHNPQLNSSHAFAAPVLAGGPACDHQ